jgi:alpha-tubulin suppressor-like RCC1 family protein
MADRFPGGVISKTPPTVVAPVDGEGGSASGVWTLDEVLGYEKAGAWPKRVFLKELYAWGYGNVGRTGLNQTASVSSPVQVGALTDWKQINASGARSAAIKTDGTMWAWGFGYGGALGDGTTINRSSPVQIGALTTWDNVDTGPTFSTAVKIDGTLWTWGANSNGQLGDGTVVDKSSPVQVGSLTSWAVSAAGYLHGLAVKSDGTLWAWGRNDAGQLGDNTVVRRSSPIQVGALTNWQRIDAGNDTSLSVTTSNALYMWGSNNAGHLGQNNTINVSSPVQVGALTDWRVVALSSVAGAVSAVKTDGSLWSWGTGNDGSMGDGTTVNKSSPIQIGALTTWSTVACGNEHKLAVKTDGTLWAWGGQNPTGALGDGTKVNKSSPIQIGALTNWSQVSAGGSFSLALSKVT